MQKTNTVTLANILLGTVSKKTIQALPEREKQKVRMLLFILMCIGIGAMFAILVPFIQHTPEFIEALMQYFRAH